MNVPAGEDYKEMRFVNVKHVKEFLSYVSIGVVGKIISLLVLHVLFTWFHFSLSFSGFIGFLASLFFIIQGNSKLVFNTKIKTNIFIKYCLAMVLTCVIYLMLLSFFYIIFNNHLIGSIVASITNYPFHFVLNKFFVFKENH